MVGIMADGMSSTSIAYSRATVTFSPDNIAEFKVITSSFSAKYGVTGGGVISTVSKSGGEGGGGRWFCGTRQPARPGRGLFYPPPARLRFHRVCSRLTGAVSTPHSYHSLNTSLL